MKKAPVLKILALLKKIKPIHYLAIAIVIAIGIFNGVTGVMPHINQARYEKGIVKSFNRWWNEEGAERFKSIGLEPTEKIKQEEFEQFRERALSLKPSYIVEDRIKTMNQEFREWWETKGGKEAFADEHKRYPSEADFQRELTTWVDNYTDKFTRYHMAFVPRQGHYDRLLTSWMLFPSVWSYLVFAAFFIFAFVQLERRWKWFILWGCIIGWALGGGVLVDMLTGTSFFDHYDNDRYMGLSLALAFLLGGTAFAPKKDLAPQLVSAICFAGLVLDMAINWFVNPGLFGAVTILSPIAFAGGAAAGLNIETRRKTKHELKIQALEERAKRVANRNPMAEMKIKTRSMIEAGFASAKDGQFDQAQRLLTQAMTQLLQEHPIDAVGVKQLTERITKPSLYIEISSNQWLEWGEIAKAKNAHEAAIMLLKKSLSIEKDRNFARRTLYVLGETCVNHEIDIEEGYNRLRKVIEMNGNDMLAKQARHLLEINNQPLTVKKFTQAN